MSSDRKPPSLPRRRRSQNSNTSEQSGNQSFMSAQEDTRRTAELTLSTHSPATLAGSQNLGVSQSNSNQSSRGRLGHPLSEKQLASKLVMTEEKVRAFLEDYFEDYGSIGEGGFEAWSLFFQRYSSPDYLFVRPSGNPIDSFGLANILSTDLKVDKYILVSIDDISIMQTRRSAIVLYTADQIFSYKGTLNEDRAVISCVMEYRGDEIKIIHEHRTSGKPIPRETRWLVE
jgi:hypothetical protein